jgi:hypothetical protein
MWLAGAYEGYAASILLCLELKINVEELLGRDLKNIIQSGKTLEVNFLSVILRFNVLILGCSCKTCGR